MPVLQLKNGLWVKNAFNKDIIKINSFDSSIVLYDYYAKSGKNLYFSTSIAQFLNTGFEELPTKITFDDLRVGMFFHVSGGVLPINVEVVEINRQPKTFKIKNSSNGRIIEFFSASLNHDLSLINPEAPQPSTVPEAIPSTKRSPDANQAPAMGMGDRLFQFFSTPPAGCCACGIPKHSCNYHS